MRGIRSVIHTVSSIHAGSVLPTRSRHPAPHALPVRCATQGTAPSGGAYLARFQTTVAVPPPDAEGTVYVSASPVRVKGRCCSVPSHLGNSEVSILKVMVWSAALTETVPKWAMLPWTMALFSSGVALVRLLEATLGRSARAMTST